MIPGMLVKCKCTMQYSYRYICKKPKFVSFTQLTSYSWSPLFMSLSRHSAGFFGILTGPAWDLS
jgi:hypothetical protein